MTSLPCSPLRASRGLRRAACALVLLAPVVVLAQGLAPATSPEPFEGQSMFGLLVKSCLMLGLVVAITWLSLNYGLRKLMGIKGGPLGGRQANLVSVMQRIPLDQKRAMFVVKAADEYLLVGGGEDLQLITRLDTATVERLQREEQERPPPQLSPFLQKLLTKKTPPPPKA